MKTRSPRTALSLFLTLSACGGAPDGLGARDDSTGTTQQDLRAIGSTSATSSTSGVAVSRPRMPLGSPVALPVITNPVNAPPVDADLRPDGAMRFYGAYPNLPTEGLQVDVMNVGSDPAYGPTGSLSINGYVFGSVLYQYYGGTATAANTLNPGERGYLEVQIPYGFLQDCQSYVVQIDLNQNMQAGPNVFANDTRSALAYETGVVCPLGWTNPINAATVGATLDPHEDGKSLQDIVSGVEVARVDGYRCSACHNNANPVHVYQPDVAPSEVSSPLIDAFQPSGGNVLGPVNWACGGNPWAAQFVAQPDDVKPPYLKAAFQKWMSDGTLP